MQRLIHTQSAATADPTQPGRFGLSTLEGICELILQSHDLDETLENIVQFVAARMRTEVCSIYLLDEARLHLRATEGLSARSVGSISMDVGEGLVGHTAEIRAVVNTREPQQHPRFRLFAESNEERYHSFVGIPLYDRQQVIGVIALQTIVPREFSSIEISTLTTIAFQLSTVIVNARLIDSLRRERGSAGVAVPIQTEPCETERRDMKPVLHGIVVTGGVATAPAHVIDESLGFAEIIEPSEHTDVECEHEKLCQSIEKSRVETICLEKRIAERLSASDAAIFHSHLLILEDRSFLGKLESLVESGQTAIHAVKSVVSQYLKAFRSMEDPYLRERALDIEDVGRRIIANLGGEPNKSLKVTHPGILIARELLPSEIASIDFDMIRGIVVESDHSNSHAVIVAKSMGIPAMIGVQGVLEQVEPGSPLILDANRGCVYIEPDEQIKGEYQRLINDDRRREERLLRFRDRTPMTRDGETICLRANIGLLSDVEIAKRNGASGVGLYRTEIPFMSCSTFPSREQQYELYRRIVDDFDGAPVTFRTLDIGGDKALPYFSPPREENPSLGWRSVRVSLHHRDVFRTQIEAVLMAASHGTVRLVFPMICSTGEMRDCRRVVDEAREHLRRDGFDPPEIPLGAMIEVPAAVCIANHLSNEADFFALGTNDLVQYMLAADRGNPMVHQYYDPLHPAILQAIRQLVEVAANHRTPLSVCGEMASDPGCLALLVGLGLREFSVAAPAISRLKSTLSQLCLRDLQTLAQSALEQDQAKGIRESIDRVLERVE